MYINIFLCIYIYEYIPITWPIKLPITLPIKWPSDDWRQMQKMIRGRPYFCRVSF